MCRQDPKELLAMAFMKLSEDTPVRWKDMIGALTCSPGTLHASTDCRIVVAQVDCTNRIEVVLPMSNLNFHTAVVRQ